MVEARSRNNQQRHQSRPYAQNANDDAALRGTGGDHTLRSDGVHRIMLWKVQLARIADRYRAHAPDPGASRVARTRSGRRRVVWSTARNSSKRTENFITAKKFSSRRNTQVQATNQRRVPVFPRASAAGIRRISCGDPEQLVTGCCTFEWVYRNPLLNVNSCLPRLPVTI